LHVRSLIKRISSNHVASLSHTISVCQLCQ